MRTEGWVGTVSVPILASGGPVEIDDDFKAIILRPTDSLGQVGTLALDVRLTWTDIIRPIADRDTNVIQPINGHQLAPEMEKASATHPAAAICAKSL